VFHNYLAYDDGTAEKSYFLNLFATLPGKIAVEYHLNQPDTLFGFAIYFGRQVPLAFSKFFGVQVYLDIAFNGGTDQKIYEESLFFPGYADTVNKFFYYRLVNPVPLPAGLFYLATQQPAQSGSDSLYFGLDVNRLGANHLYYNVDDSWQSSSVSGALMIRPLLDNDFTPTVVHHLDFDPNAEKRLTLYPNPAVNSVSIRSMDQHIDSYEVLTMAGQTIATGKTSSGSEIDISGLIPGYYLLNLKDKAGQTIGYRKLVKM
jgi:hypothetical protein